MGHSGRSWITPKFAPLASYCDGVTMISDTSSDHSTRSLCSKGPPDDTAIQNPPKSRKAPAFWTTEEEQTLLEFLQSKLSSSGDGGFQSKAFVHAASHFQKQYLKYRGAEKTASVCKTKWTALKGTYNLVMEIKKMSGWVWTDEGGANIEAKDGDSWDRWAKGHTGAKVFRNKGFNHFHIIDNMMPHKSKGDFIYCPGDDTAPPTPPAAASSSAPDTLNLAQLATAANKIGGHIAAAGPRFDPQAPSSDIPSTFLSGSTASSVVTSVSQTKRKHTEMGSAVSSGSAAKRSRPPSASVKAQQEGSDAIMKFNNIFEGFIDKFNNTQMSLNPEYACAIRMLKEHDGAGLSAQERMGISSFMGRHPKEVTLYINSDDDVRALWVQQTLATINAMRQSAS
ncbi:hypothetical protein DFH29DRAFT_994199 [Suillus ampliporus]|nr:hypothetical protein DFH29DRAFT_994199 [Suillus ampliporus]